MERITKEVDCSLMGKRRKIGGNIVTKSSYDMFLIPMKVKQKYEVISLKILSLILLSNTW
jgi:hypothetical protein